MVCLKAKESYHARCVEYEKMKRENASSKDLDKVEAKYKKASESCCFVSLLLLLVCVSFTIIGQPRNSVLIRRV